MSIAIQALTSLQATANHLPVNLPRALLAGLIRDVEKPVVLDKPAALSTVIATEFQQGTRNARIEILASGEHSVLCYDASSDYNEMLIRQSMQAAVEAAQGWVKRAF